MRPIYPSRLATAVFLLSVVVFAAGVTVGFVTGVTAGLIVAFVGLLGVWLSSWVNHKRRQR